MQHMNHNRGSTVEGLISKMYVYMSSQFFTEQTQVLRLEIDYLYVQ